MLPNTKKKRENDMTVYSFLPKIIEIETKQKTSQTIVLFMWRDLLIENIFSCATNCNKIKSIFLRCDHIPCFMMRMMIQS